MAEKRKMIGSYYKPMTDEITLLYSGVTVDLSIGEATDLREAIDVALNIKAKANAMAAEGAV